MRNFVCPNCGNKILQEYTPKKNWFVFGTRNGGTGIEDCGTHEPIQEFDTQDEALKYISDTASLHEARFISDDAQK